jgi:ribosomal protein L30E
MNFYGNEKLDKLLKLEWRNNMATIYESDLDALITSHENSIKDARDDVNYYALLNDDKLVAYYEGRIVSLQISLNQLRNLRNSLFGK